ncbi:MAG: hypothetical protein Q9227_009515, partial [Pyrenula ochraceoflavens]
MVNGGNEEDNGSNILDKDDSESGQNQSANESANEADQSANESGNEADLSANESGNEADQSDPEEQSSNPDSAYGSDADTDEDIVDIHGRN